MSDVSCRSSHLIDLKGETVDSTNTHSKIFHLLFSPCKYNLYSLRIFALSKHSATELNSATELDSANELDPANELTLDIA